MAPSDNYEQLTVADLMTPSPETASPQDTLAEVKSTMELSSIHHLPVTDGDGQVVGILSHRDLLRAIADYELTAPIGGLMTQDTLCVQPHTRLCEASALLLDHKIGALPVVDDNDQLVGIITETDFVRFAHEISGGWQLSDED